MTVFTASPPWDLTRFPQTGRRSWSRCFTIWFPAGMRYRESLLPAVILIPGVSGNTGKGIEGVKKSVEQAVGSDILFGGV